jgi:hypothetical protein
VITDRGFGGRPLRAAPGLLLVSLLAGAGVADAAPRLSVDGYLSATVLDPGLDEFRWSLATHPGWTVQARTALGVYRFGARVSGTGTTQGTGLPDEPREPEVALTSLQAVAERSAFQLAGVDVLAHLGVGLLHVSWDPDEASYDVPGFAEPVTVSYDSIDDWTVSLGGAFERTLLPRLSAAIEIDHTWFLMDVSRRDGDLVEISREAFGNWNARLGLSWHLIP